MKSIFILLSLCTLSVLSIGQTVVPDSYYHYIKKADSLCRIGDYEKSAQHYSKAFAAFENRGFQTDRYNAACSWALTGQKDSAFVSLYLIANKTNYSNYNHLIQDEDLIALHNDKRWDTLVNIVKSNKDKKEHGINKALSIRIDSLTAEDQKWRGLVRQLNNSEIDSISKDTISKYLRITDSLNFFHLQDIISNYGHPTIPMVGQNSSKNFWLLVQHQDKNVSFQLEVLKLMKIEVDKGLVAYLYYAYLIDRVKVNSGELQVYGTQMTLNAKGDSYEPKPCIEPSKLNERRKEAGLPPIEVYIETMNTRYFGDLSKETN